MAKEDYCLKGFLSEKGEAIVAIFTGELKRAKLRNAAPIESHARLAIAYAQSLAGMRHGLCNIDNVPLRVTFDLEDDPDPNGVCLPVEEGFEIRITKGLLYQQVELCGFIASQTNCLTNFYPGEASTSDALKPVLTTYIPPEEPNFAHIISQVWPTDRHRSQFAGDLFQMSLQFLWGHELAHAQYAHVDHIKEHLNLTALHEGSTARAIHSPLLFKALERHADWVAASQLCEVLLSTKSEDQEKLLNLVPLIGGLLGVTWDVFETPIEPSLRTHPLPSE